jgi:prevent-host-death family protein
MKSTVSISEGQNDFPALIKAAENGEVVTVARHGKPVATVIGYERMSAIVETLEIMANPAAMKAISDHRAGKLQSHDIDDIPE